MAAARTIALCFLATLRSCSPLATTKASTPHWYFSCRHTYEQTLTDELGRIVGEPLSTSVAAPGLVRVEGSAALALVYPSGGRADGGVAIAQQLHEHVEHHGPLPLEGARGARRVLPKKQPITFPDGVLSAF